MFNLQDLLNPQQNAQPNPFTDFQNDIVVQGTPFSNEIRGGGGLGIQGLLEASQPDVERARQAGLPEHKGMFGVKGTLRDVLGLVGDAFLVQGGRNPMYQPKRQQERESDAIQGYAQDPVAALERLAEINPQAAMKAFEQLSVQQARQQAQTQREAEFKAGSKKRALEEQQLQEKVVSSQLDNIGRAISSPSAKKNWPRMKENLYQNMINLGLEDYAELLPDEWNEDIGKTFMDPAKLQTLLQQSRSLESRERIAGQSDATRRLGIRTSANTAAMNEAGRNARHQSGKAPVSRPPVGGRGAKPNQTKPNVSNW